MHSCIWKGLIIVGLGMTFAGLVCMIEAGFYKADNGKKYYSFPPIRPELAKVGWVLIIGGYIYQIIGVIAS